ncbi:hypothetical protein COHA_006201 [Chlorella ohadii]|uniref:Uncharacterized protein n=1 Tax=Chlorella ohadii TaxID=2649997 RepID=A0AAD5DN88_9CHLO|nr:hypothetical protein COHA_006201 [Chlorella ohadii]
MGSLEELLLNELQETGVFDLAASVGIVQHGRLQGGGRPEEAWPPHPQPPLGAAVPQQMPQQQQVPDHGMDAEELHAGDASATAGGLSSMAGAGGGAAGAGREEPLGKASALRHFSLKVCEKVESKIDTSYEEVANELIADIAAEVAAGTAEAATDEKNIRRRCYDALNVLEAIGMITKTKKSIRWKGWPTGLGRSAEERLRSERLRAMERLDQKRQLLEDAIQKCYCLSNLVSRNHAVPLPVLLRMQESGQRVPNPLKLPFILVRTDKDAELHVDISPDNLQADIDFGSWPFAILDDDQVMKLLDLQHPSPLLDSALQQQQRQLAAGWPVLGGYPGGPALLAQQQELPQLRPAAAATLQQFQQQQQQVQQQQQQQHQLLPPQPWPQQQSGQQQQPVLRPALQPAPPPR